MSSVMRIGAPSGRSTENKASIQPTVKVYKFSDNSIVFNVLGYDTPKEEHMLNVAWDFYRHALDYDGGAVLRSRTNHFEMFARFFIADQIGRKVPGLYAFLRDAPTIVTNKRIFWPAGHPNDNGVDLPRCNFNMSLLAENVHWYVDYETRFWNTLEFRIGEPSAKFAALLLNDYRKWLEDFGLTAGYGYLQAPAAEFEKKAEESKHPFFTNKAGRLDPSLWKNNANALLVVRPQEHKSPQKRRVDEDDAESVDTGQGDSDSAMQGDSNSMALVPISMASGDVERKTESPTKRLREMTTSSSSNSMQLEPVASGIQTLLRTMVVPQFGVEEGNPPRLAYIFENSISLKALDRNDDEMPFQPPFGVSNTGDNIISIVYNKTQDGKAGTSQVILVMITTEEKGASRRLIVRENSVTNGRQQQGKDLIKTSLSTARPIDCCVSWDGRRIVVNDALANGSGYQIHVIDFFADASTNMLLGVKMASATYKEPILACTSTVFAINGGFLLGSISVPKGVSLKAPQDLRLLSVSTNAWMQPSVQMQELNEARKHAVFVHLYEQQDKTLLAVVTPLNGATVDSEKTFTVKLAYNAPRQPNDAMVPRVLWYPLPAYAASNTDQLPAHNIDTTKDRALVIWCIHKDYTVVTTAPVSNDENDYVPAVTLTAKYTPTPILNNLLLQVFDSDFNAIDILNFDALNAG